MVNTMKIQRLATLQVDAFLTEAIAMTGIKLCASMWRIVEVVVKRHKMSKENAHYKGH